MIAARYYAASGAAIALPANLSYSDAEQRLLVHLDGETQPLRVSVTELNLSERFSRATRNIYLPDGAMLEVDDGAALSAMLGASSQRDNWVTRWQHSWPKVVFSFVASVVLLALAYVYVLPVAADRLAHRVPASWAEALDKAVLAQLNYVGEFEKSSLSEEKQQVLQQRFKAIVDNAQPQSFAGARGDTPIPKVFFYNAGKVPNAFALPGGSIVFFDEIVRLAPDDDAIVGVFAHEYGHVIHRHGLRNLLRSAVVTAIAAWYFGDFTSLANAAIVVSQLSYSRDFEREADDAAVQIMRSNGLNTKSLAALFRKMRDYSGRDSSTKDSAVAKQTETPQAGGTGADRKEKKKLRLSVPEFLSTHPDIDERIERFEKL